MKSALQKLFEGQSLTRAEAARAMGILMSGEAVPEQAAALLGALRAKRETREELTGFAEAMRERMVPLSLALASDNGGILMDTCGTGGSLADTFNISTAVAFLLAAAGVRVAKHGNRSVSSRCGSADVLEALGLPIDLPPEESARCLDENGFAFLFAPAYHPALRHVGPVRRAIGVRTVLNILGPLVNPARVRRQVVGVPDARLGVLMAEVLRELGSEEVMVVTGEDGLDELSLNAPTQVCHLKGGQIRQYRIAPEDIGLARAPLEAIRGGDAAENAATLEALLKGELQGPRREVVRLNCAAALVVAGLAGDLREGAARAGELLDQGAGFAVLSRVKKKGASG